MPYKDINKKRASGREWYQKHKEEVKLRRKEKGYEYTRNLKRWYNITTKQYEEMVVKQEGKCLICGIHRSELLRNLDVDHNHNTKQIRGLLCSNCNFLIGHCKESIYILRKAADYLEKWSSKK